MSTPKPDAGTVAISPSDIAKEKPHNIAIEQALLAALMNIEEAYDLVSSTVVAEDFYGERHRHIFRCIAHLA
ncbi:MAG: DnaB-like helicase N-terminal domain-containing protein, partial [Moraxella sp.]|nr:DnaB-like helicase N-terminal domain-containing protein [Moraxella sp.]